MALNMLIEVTKDEKKHARSLKNVIKKHSGSPDAIHMNVIYISTATKELGGDEYFISEAGWPYTWFWAVLSWWVWLILCIIVSYNWRKMDSKKLAEDPSTKELNQFVQTMLKQMQERFDDMSSNIVGRVD